MKESLLKAMRYCQIVDVMYILKSGEVTMQHIKVLKLYGESFQAYCFLRNIKRTFLIDSILALIPVQSKENMVI